MGSVSMASYGLGVPLPPLRAHGDAAAPAASVPAEWTNM